MNLVKLKYNNFDNIKNIMKFDDNFIKVLKEVVGALFLDNYNDFCELYNNKIEDINNKYDKDKSGDYIQFIKNEFKCDFEKLNKEKCKDLIDLGFIISLNDNGEIYLEHILDKSINICWYLDENSNSSPDASGSP